MKTMKVLAAVAAIALPLQFAHAEDQFFSAQLGIADADGMSNGTALILGYGMELAPEIVLEGEFSTTISEPSHSYTAAGFDHEVELSYYTVGGYASYVFPATENFDIYGRLGLLYGSFEYTNRNKTAGTSVSDTDNDFNLTYGVGINVGVAQNIDFTANITVTDPDVNQLSAGIKYKF